MDLNGRVKVPARHAVGRARWRVKVVVLAVCAAALVIPINAASASAPSAAASGPVVKVGMIYSLTGPLAASPEVKDALLASVAAFNKRGGVGTNGAKLEAVICDSRSDANGEVDCARQMVDDGVVATLNDLTFNNPSGVNGVLEGAKIPRVGIGGTDISEFGSSVSFPVSAGVIAAYLGTAVGFKQDGNTKICLMRTDAPTGATFRGFLTPSFTAIGIEIICDVSVATGATDYAPYIAQLQQEDPDAVLISHTDAVATQLIGAMSQLNAKIPLGGSPGSFKLETIRKYKDITKGTVLSDSFPYPDEGEREELPGAEAVLRRHEGVGQELPESGQAEDLGLLRLDLHARLRQRHQGSRFLHAGDRRRGVGDGAGRRSPRAGPAVDAVDAGLQRLHVELEPLRVRLPVQRKGHRHQQDAGRRHAVHPVTAG